MSAATIPCAPRQLAKTEDGGQAFPTHDVFQDCGPDGNSGPILAQVSRPGMSLREWFAGMAMAGGNMPHNLYSHEENAKWAYERADAMLAERAK